MDSERTGTTTTGGAFDPTPLSELQRRFRSVPLPIPTSATKPPPAPVPAPKSPPVSRKTPGVHTHATTQKHTAQYFGRQHRVPSTRSCSSTTPTTAPRQAAYERKKQRAKDARIRLNESIDRLSIAMRVASQQASQRLQQQQQTSRRHLLFAPDTQRSMQDCVTIAESAKKFDRPSFVGTAADLVHGLNAQCEALAREVQHLRHTTTLMAQPEPSKETTTASNETAMDTTANTMASSRIRSTVDASLVFRQSRILAAVQSYLDPHSLARSSRVAKTWSSSAPHAWDQLALARFGVYHVRQWRDKLEPQRQQLYRAMAAASVAPRQQQQQLHHHTNDNDLLLLGHTHHPHTVQCWVYLRKRSNGETKRSIQLQDGSYACVPVVELRIVLQSTCGDGDVVLHDGNNGLPVITVDASTRRRKRTFTELTTDPRFRKRVLLGGTAAASVPCRLRLFDTVTLQVHIQCDGCATLAKCMQRSNYCLLTIGRTTIHGTSSSLPLVVPFPRDVVGVPGEDDGVA